MHEEVARESARARRVLRTVQLRSSAAARNPQPALISRPARDVFAIAKRPQDMGVGLAMWIGCPQPILCHREVCRMTRSEPDPGTMRWRFPIGAQRRQHHSCRPHHQHSGQRVNATTCSPFNPVAWLDSPNATNDTRTAAPSLTQASSSTPRRSSSSSRSNRAPRGSSHPESNSSPPAPPAATPPARSARVPSRTSSTPDPPHPARAPCRLPAAPRCKHR